MLHRIIFILFFLFAIVAYGQDLPPIIKYNTSTYSAANQNWMISQDSNQYMYFANNDGLLEYNGTNWTLYHTPNETILRSVKTIGNRIYTGCYMEFGYWERLPDGTLQYHSLADTIKDKIIDDEQFWNIAKYDHWVIFQSLNQIFIYNTKKKSFKIIKSEAGINKVYIVGNAILYQTFGTGLYEIENGKSKLVSDDAAIKNNKIVNIFTRNEHLLLQTQFNGFFKFKNGTVSPWTIPADDILKGSSIYSSQMLSDGSFALGSVSNGIFILSPSGALRYHMTQNKGLSNNTALSLYEDHDNNLWVGLDNGINCINLQSAVRSFVDDTGFLGTIYASVHHDDLLYVGTNQGLFYKTYGTDDEFKFIPNTKGQVWSLYEYRGTLFCCHDSGTYVIDKGKATHIFSTSGTWKLEQHPDNSNLLLQGNYHGISVLEQNSSGTWQLRNWIKGFDYSSRYFEVGNNKDIYISHEYKGVFRISINENYTKAINFFTYSKPEKGKNASLCKYNGAIYYASKDGIFKLNAATKKFERDKKLSGIFLKDEYTSGKLMADRAGRLWFFTKNYINYLTSGKLNTDLKHSMIPIPSTLTNSIVGYENITQINTNNYLIGTANGYYSLNLAELSFNKYNVCITSIITNVMNRNTVTNSITTAGEFEHSENNFTFNYAVPEYNKYINAEFQYLLEGMQEEWSEWNTKPFVNFKNLSPGSYTFKVRARTGNSISPNTAKYSFTIAKPWYATTVALIIYLIIALIAAYFINRAYKNYYHRQKDKLIEENKRLLEIKELEKQQEVMKIKNEQLQQEFENKNRELAVSTMNLIKKNELLSMIKDDLKKTTDGDRNIKSVITTINKNINEDDTWDMFKEAFNNADKDFLKKVKSHHPSLTPNDLRLCAYLRLNLASKEIAPLLNISVRSVEIKRYRLRKKMELPHEVSLVEYILSL